MYEYEMSEKLFLDIWEKYECPEEVSDPLTIYNILNDIIVKSKHWIVCKKMCIKTFYRRILYWLL